MALQALSGTGAVCRDAAQGFSSGLLQLCRDGPLLPLVFIQFSMIIQRVAQFA